MAIKLAHLYQKVNLTNLSEKEICEFWKVVFISYFSQKYFCYNHYTVSYLPNPSAWTGYDTRSIFLSGV